MPYINTTVSTSISKESQTSIKTKLGKAISLIPGKTESWLMLSFNENKDMYFKGSNEKPLAYVTVSLFGSASDSAYDALTAEITKIIHEELAIDPACIYVKYEEISHWGWNGVNF